MPGLYVVEYAADFDSIDRALRREIDDRLFLSKEFDRRYDDFVYVVLCEVAGDHPPVCVTEWREETGRPLPLSSGILERVRSQRARGGVAAIEAFAANEAMQERNRREADEAMDEIGEDVGARISEKRSAVLHRGVGLRRARDKRRARGEKA